MMEEITQILVNTFKSNGYHSVDFFDFSIWFTKNNGLTSDILNETPNDSEDIIKSLLIKAYARSKLKNLRIRVRDFIDELNTILIHLNKEKQRVDKLIELYDAYETKNTIEQNISNFERIAKNRDTLKSKLQVYIKDMNNLPTGEYKLSLMVVYLNTVDKNSNEVTHEYKLNHIIRNDKENATLVFNDIREYCFPKIELFSYENSNIDLQHDNGTNMLYYFIKSENLSKSYLDVAFSEKKSLLDLLLNGMKNILKNNNKMSALLDSNCSFLSQDYEFRMNFKVHIEFDPCTLSAIYGKIFLLLQNMISYHVLLEHKLKTILNYFPEIRDAYSKRFDEKKEKKSDCLII
jgi:hypothetical protein